MQAVLTLSRQLFLVFRRLNLYAFYIGNHMRVILSLILVVGFAAAALGQNEQSPIVEKEIGYRDWSYKNLNGGGETNLRKFTVGKKLVMVVYWAPWCPNWKHDLAFVQQLHEKYKDKGFAIIGVGEYDPVEKMRAHVTQYGLTFPMVYESDAQAARETTVHFSQRRAAGDARKWGSPWYVFLEPKTLKAGGEILADKVNLVNGELIKGDAEKFIQGKLGLSEAKASAELEACEPEKKITALVKP